MGIRQLCCMICWAAASSTLVCWSSRMRRDLGKSTLSFHSAFALAHKGRRVLAIDCDRGQQTLNRLLEARDGTIRTLKVNPPRPYMWCLRSRARHCSYRK